jgi:hypothetical protein
LSRESDLQRDLIPVNAIIGLLKRDRQWPSALYELGYRLTMIEQPIIVPGVGTVEVDTICLNRVKNHAILWECKAGRTLGEKQARVYSAIKAEDVQRTGNVTFPRPDSATIDVVYCCLSENAKGISESFQQLALALPVISLGNKAELFSGQIRAVDVQKRFMAGIDLPPLEDVPRFLLANTQTPKVDLARLLFPTLVSLLRKQVGKVSVRLVLEETFNDWSCMGTDLRRYLSDRFKELILDLCKNELEEYASIVKASHSPSELFIEFSGGILGSDASSRTRAFQKFEKLAYGFVERIEKDKPYEPAKEARSMWLPGFEPLDS